MTKTMTLMAQKRRTTNASHAGVALKKGMTFQNTGRSLQYATTSGRIGTHDLLPAPTKAAKKSSMGQKN